MIAGTIAGFLPEAVECVNEKSCPNCLVDI